MMVDFFVKGGWLMYPILICSLTGLAILINKFFQFRRVLKAIERPLKDIIGDPPRILLPLLKAVENGSGEKKLSVIGTRQVREMEKGLSWLSLIATIAPLLGLTGTVTGMIKAFMVIAESNTQVSPALLASGIWEALITTAGGLLVAIPVHIGHHYLEKQADEIAFALKEITLGLLARGKNGV
jgi:biopolymer transport protein ExbB